MLAFLLLSLICLPSLLVHTKQFPPPLLHWNCSSLVLWIQHDPNGVESLYPAMFTQCCLPPPSHGPFLQFVILRCLYVLSYWIITHKAMRRVLLMGLIHHYLYNVCHGAWNTLDSQLTLIVLRDSWKNKNANETFQNCVWNGKESCAVFMEGLVKWKDSSILSEGEHRSLFSLFRNHSLFTPLLNSSEHPVGFYVCLILTYQVCFSIFHNLQSLFGNVYSNCSLSTIIYF